MVMGVSRPWDRCRDEPWNLPRPRLAADHQVKAVAGWLRRLQSGFFSSRLMEVPDANKRNRLREIACLSLLQRLDAQAAQIPCGSSSAQLLTDTDKVKEQSRAQAAASSWTAQESTASFSQRHEHIFAQLAGLLTCVPRFPAPRILSFGCSSGYECLDLKRLCPSAFVLGCDVSEKAVMEAQKRCAQSEIIIFPSTPEAVAQNGPYDVITAMSVLTRYPAIRDKAEIDGIYSFNQFERMLGVLIEALSSRGLLVIYNSPYLFERTRYARRFRKVLPASGPGNGWIDKYDEHGRQLTRVEARFHKQIFRNAKEWRKAIQEHYAKAWTGHNPDCFPQAPSAEMVPYQHILLRDSQPPPDCATVIWQKI